MKRKCPKCKKEIEIDAIRCAHCGVWVEEIDEKRGSKGIIILGIWLVLQGISQFIYSLTNTLFSIVYIPLSLIIFILAYGIFTLKEWGRTGTIIIQSLLMLQGLFVCIITVLSVTVLKKQNSLFTAIISRDGVGIMIVLAYTVAIVYFLTRPKVKEQFK